MKKSYIFIILVIILAILCGILVYTLFIKSNGSNSESKPLIPKSYTFSDSNNIVSVVGKKEYNLSQDNNDDSHLLNLSDKSGFKFLVSKLDGVESKSLDVIANADKEVYTSSYSEVMELSEIEEKAIGNYNSYTYSFKIQDTTSTQIYTMDIYYIRIKEATFVIDVVTPVVEGLDYTEEINSLLSTLVINEDQSLDESTQ